MEPRVNFLIVGAARSGSTSLYDYLNQHPDIFMPTMKEPHYFSGVSHIMQSYEDYLSLFNGYNGEKMIGEASTSYLLVPETAQKIFDTLGRIKIIILLRNPVERAFSNWHLEHLHKTRETLSFEEALEKEEDRYNHRNDLFFWPGIMYFRSGLYFEQVKRYYEIFGRGQVKVLIFEEFVDQPVKWTKEVFRFLGVDSTITPNITQNNAAHQPKYPGLYDFLSTPPSFLLNLFNRLPKTIKNQAYNFLSKLHRSNRKPLQNKLKINPETYTALMEKYIPDIENLEGLLERDLSIWYANSD